MLIKHIYVFTPYYVLNAFIYIYGVNTYMYLVTNNSKIYVREWFKVRILALGASDRS